MTERVNPQRGAGGVPQHHLAITVWVAVVPTLTALQLVLGDAVQAAPRHVRPLITATLAVPIVVYVLMPRLLRFSSRLVRR